MEFRDFAANQTSALISRLLVKCSERSSRELQMLRQALDAATRTVETTFGTWTQLEEDDDISALVDRLTAASAAHAQASTQRANEEAQATIGPLRAELDARSSEKEALVASLKDARAELDSLQAELQNEKDRAEAAGAERAEARDAQNRAEAARQEIEAAWTEHARAKAAIESELKEVRRLYDTAQDESARVSQQVESAANERARLAAALCDAAAQLQAVEAQRQTVTAHLEAGIARIEALERNGAENDRARHDLQVRLDAAVTAETMIRQRAAEADLEWASAHRKQIARFDSLLDGLLTAFNDLKATRTVADVLTTVVKGLASEFSRVVLFTVKGDQLESEQHVGFDFEDRVSKVVIPLTTDTLVTRAVASGRNQCVTASEFTDNNRALFGGTPARALALPIAAYGETLAVIYADYSDQPQSQFAPAALEVRVKFAELLLRLAVMPLIQVSPQLKALAELDDYAAMLLSEAEYIYAADVTAGKNAAELQRRLKDNLECARRIYAQRVASEEPRAATLLEECLAVVIETRSATPFGRDLAAIAERERPEPEHAAQRSIA